jgi:thymidylate synthase (FAD)
MKIDKDSAKPFVERMVSSNHLAMCEHGTIYLHVAYEEGFFVPESLLVKHYRENKYSKVMQIGSDYYITTNYRVIVENNWFEDLDYICEPTEWHEKRITVRFTTQIAVSREANRHRVDSVAEQSTRYCNYSKDKFGGEIAINKPKWVSDDDAVNPLSFDGGTFVDLSKNIGSYEHWSPVEKWWFANRVCEMMYLSLVKDDGLKPQDARTILPLDTNTELIHTAFVSDWKHFFELRSLGTTGKPHPDIEVLATPLMNEFKERGLL